LARSYFRTNEWRRLKTAGSKRTVPLWPQLQEILEAYVADRERDGGLGALLFPSVGGRPRDPKKDEGEEETESVGIGETAETETKELMIRDLRKQLDTIGERAGFPAGHVRLHMLRHTYTAARIQTLDRGAPIALYTVARELGHSSTGMIEARYGHLHDRAVLGGSEVVEFRVQAYQTILETRLAALSTATHQQATKASRSH
jgi:integrase